MYLLSRFPVPLLLACLGFMAGAEVRTAHGQPLLTQEQAATLHPVPADAWPQSGTFWSLQRYGTWPPMPFQPFPTLNTFQLPDGSFLYDDSQVDYPALEQQRETDRALRALEAQYGLETVDSGGPPLPGPGGGSGGPEPGPDPHNNKDYPTNSLWLDILSVSNNSANLLLHGTVPDVVYDLWTKQALTDSVWLAESWVVGAAETNVTPASIPVGSRTNALFVWARSWGDEDGNGLPDWWELQYFVTNGVDPYASLAADGWTTLDKYQRGWNPTNFYTPPPPRNVVASLDPLTSVVTVTWEPGGGPVTNYALRSGWYGSDDFDWNEVANSPPGICSLTHAPDFDFLGFDPDIEPAYLVRAYFADGSHADSAHATVHRTSLGLKIDILRGPSGGTYLAVQSPPPNLERLRLSWGIWEGVWLDVFATNLVAGIIDVSQVGFDPRELRILAIDSDGSISARLYPQRYDYVYETGHPYFSGRTLIDARTHLKENLKFLLSAATTSTPFCYASSLHTDGTSSLPNSSFIGLPERYYARPETPLGYEYYGFHCFSSNLDYAVLQPLRPLQENYLWRNLVFDPLDFHYSNGWTNGVGDDSHVPGLRLLTFPHYYFSGSITNPSPLALNSTNHTYPYSGRAHPSELTPLFELGLNLTAEYMLSLPPETRNLFGLPVNSVLLHDYTTNGFAIQAGGAPALWPLDYDFLFPSVAAPLLLTTGYCFASQSPHFRYGAARPPIPGSPDFSVTNTSPVLLAPFAEPFTLSCWAKQAILNGDSNKFAFLEQYFEKAYQIDAAGTVTTNEAGLLSPYGEFFPTHPGPAALVTMPDIDTGQRGTGLVHVIKLQLDVNHDGAMDLSFAGPDNTSQARPFVFWVNNDYDRWDTAGSDREEDDLANANCPYTSAPTPDCEYRDWLAQRIIPSLRDLEDFARLWVAGITTNMYASLPPGVVAELSWGDKGNPDTNNPTIDVFGTPEINGGIGYLTNFSTAWQQTNSSWYGIRLGPGDSVPVLFTNSAGWQSWSHAIWCGVKRGSGKLTLTFSQGTNTIAEASAYIELKDIKEMYERWTVGDSPQIAPTNKPYLAREDLPVGPPPFQYLRASGTNTPYILLVHDYDLPIWKKDRYAETALKRLYWQGYQGRFGLFRWPGVQNSPRPLDDSEFKAWRSAAGLLNLLTNLNAQYPGKVFLTAHGYGAISAGEALRLAGTNEPVNTYIAMQGAVASHAYDPFAPIRTLGALDSGTPNRYLWYYTNGAPPYFWGVGGSQTYINFFNTNDNVLTNVWRTDQDMKPAQTLAYQYRWDGANFLKGYLPGLLLLFPADRYEIYAYCDEARCEAIGAQLNLGGPFSGMPNLNVSTLYSPTGIPSANHSGQFKSYCADTWAFWDAVLRRMSLKQ